MGIMPHTDIDQALGLALTLDTPYWPQLPKINYSEDIYAQVSEHFPGITLDINQHEFRFLLDKFYTDLDEYRPRWDDEDFF